uniref:Uncharacterized protein n=1 Tax=Astyanax mexicanus TaxID=7994 RepID=A0A8B9HVJ2_ASTMX
MKSIVQAKMIMMYCSSLFCSLNAVLQGQRAEVEAMISDMGVGQSAVEQLSIYCVSLKKEYDNLKGSLRSSNDMCEKLKRELFSSNNKVHSRTAELQPGSSHGLTSLKKKVEILQKTLSTPTRTNEAISRLVFESPAPLELKPPHLHQPADGQDIDLNVTFDISTPEQVEKKPVTVPAKKMRLDPAQSSSKQSENIFTSKVCRDEDSMFRNSLLFRKKMFGSMLDPHSKPGSVRTGYDGLGGRTKFIQPVSF